MTDKRNYLINIIEECIMNPNYERYVTGRIEINKRGKLYAINEIRYFTNKLDEWKKFREEWDLKQVNKKQLKELEVIVREKFSQFEDLRKD